jgi:hypothetical protein
LHLLSSAEHVTSLEVISDNPNPNPLNGSNRGQNILDHLFHDDTDVNTIEHVICHGRIGGGFEGQHLFGDIIGTCLHVRKFMRLGKV